MFFYNLGPGNMLLSLGLHILAGEAFFHNHFYFPSQWWVGAPVAQWVKRWPTDLVDRVRSPLEAKSSEP